MPKLITKVSLPYHSVPRTPTRWSSVGKTPPVEPNTDISDSSWSRKRKWHNYFYLREGASLLPLLQGKPGGKDAVFFQYPRYSTLSNMQRPVRNVVQEYIQGQWIPWIYVWTTFLSGLNTIHSSLARSPHSKYMARQCFKLLCKYH